MIRYTYINNQVLNIYSTLPTINLPLNVKEVINHIPNCKYMSYQQFAKINHCSVNDVVKLCESKSGCTHYDVTNNRYLILCNQSTEHNNNVGRQRWTCGHEIGHVICKHHIISVNKSLSENSFSQTLNPEFELEADYFAATLLAPFPLFNILNIKSILDVQNIFGLSYEASLYRFKQYVKWQNNHRKTAWENDIIKLFRQRNNKSSQLTKARSFTN